jgi:hypothetical protein
VKVGIDEESSCDEGVYSLHLIIFIGVSNYFEAAKFGFAVFVQFAQTTDQRV